MLATFINVGTIEQFNRAVYGGEGLVLVEYWSPVCKGCAYMDEVVFRDPEVSEVLDRFRRVRVDVFKLVAPIFAEPCSPVILYSPDTGIVEVEVSGSVFRPSVTPTIAVLSVENGSARLVAWMVGAADAATFAKFLERAYTHGLECAGFSYARPVEARGEVSSASVPIILAGLGAATLAGILSIASPCVLPLVAGVATSLVARRNLKLVLAGIFVSFSLVSSLVVVLVGVSSVVTGLASVVASAAAIFSGLILLSDRLSTWLMSKLATPVQTRAARSARNAGDFAFGVALGAGWAPCAAPIAVGVMSLAAIQLGLAASAVLSIVYGLAALATLYAVVRIARRVKRFVLSGRVRAIERAIGAALIAAGITYAMLTVPTLVSF